jgi:N-acetylglucosamine malate deacetylase 1
MIFHGKRLLFLGAHPDDIELGCGALIHNVGEKSEMLCVTLSDNQKNPLLRNVVDEHYRSMGVLGVPRESVVLRDFSTRLFHDARQEILEYFLKLRRDFKPDIIFVHSKQDIHQDHNTMTDEALRAFAASPCWVSTWCAPVTTSSRTSWSK